MKTKPLFLFLAITCLTSLVGQTKLTNHQFQDYTSLVQEKIFVHYNTNFLLTGETLQYKVYCLNAATNTFSNLSKIAYIEIVDENYNSILKDKIMLKEGTSQGDFFIPTELKSGNYKLIAYTKWMKNTHAFFQDNLFVINSFSNRISNKNSSTKFYYNTPSKNTSIQNFSISKTVAKKREKISITLSKLIPKEGSYSISVREINAINFGKKGTAKKFITQKNQPVTIDSNTVFLPDFRGELIHGKAIDNLTKTPLANTAIGLSFLGKDGFFKIATTNANGNFYFNLDDQTYPTNASAQILENNTENSKIIFNEDKKIDFSKLTFIKLSTNKNLDKIIDKQSVYVQIQNAYKKPDSIIKQKKHKYFFKNDFTVYKLSDYTHFKTISDIMIEIIDGAWINKKGNDYHFSVRNDGLSNYALPLVLVDGYIIKNHNDLIDINTKSINTISISKKDYKINSKTYSGIINIETHNGNYIPVSKNTNYTLNINNLEPVKKYYQQDYSIQKHSRIPDYRTQLLWNPYLDTTKKEISFYTSDIAGFFEIEIEGFTHQGKPIYLKRTFQVK